MDSLPFSSVAAGRTLWSVLVCLILTRGAGLSASGAASSTAEVDVKHVFRLPQHGRDRFSFVANESLRFRPTHRNEMGVVQSIAASNWIAQPPLVSLGSETERDHFVLSSKDRAPVDENLEEAKLLSEIAVQRSLSQEWLKPPPPSNADDDVQVSAIDQQLPFSHGIWENVPDPVQPIIGPPSGPLGNLKATGIVPPAESEPKQMQPESSAQSCSLPEPRKRRRGKRSAPREKPSLSICSHSGCRRRPSFGNESSGVAERCALHKEHGHVDVVNGHCCFSGGCNRSAIFGDAEGSRSIRFCLQHRQPTHVNLRSRRCKAPGCFSQPLYGDQSKARARPERCGKHREAWHGVLTYKRCAAAPCPKIPTFGPPAEWLALRCRQHKLPADTLVVGRRCKGHVCIRRALYGVEGGKADFCPEHRTAEHVDLHSPRCKEEGCRRQAVFGFNDARGRKAFCGQHRKSSMINLAIRRRLCNFAACDKRATYGDGTKAAKFCADHARIPLQGPNSTGALFNVVKKRCQHPEGCRRHPFYGSEEEGRNLLCQKHKLPEHVFLPAHAEWRCSSAGCKRMAGFAEAANPKLLYCQLHRKGQHTRIWRSNAERIPEDYMDRMPMLPLRH